MKKVINFKHKNCKKDFERLEKALKKLEKVKDVEIDNENFVITLTLYEPIEDYVVERVIEEENFDVVDID